MELIENALTKKMKFFLKKKKKKKKTHFWPLKFRVYFDHLHLKIFKLPLIVWSCFYIGATIIHFCL